MRHLSCLELALFRAVALISCFTETGREEAERMVSLKALSATTTKIDKCNVLKKVGNRSYADFN